MLEFKSIAELTKKFSTEKKCVKFLEKTRWNGEIKCVYCNHNKVCVVKDKDYKCGKCNNRFTIRTKTIFEASKVALTKWFIAIYLATNHTKCISSCQLAKDINVTQKTAWFMLQRIKKLTDISTNVKFNSTVEVDEAYIGGKLKNTHMNKRIALRERDESCCIRAC